MYKGKTMMKNRVLTSFVTYNPNIERLIKAMKSVESQTDCMIIVDNGSSNISQIEKATINFTNVNLVKNKRNEGIARALNQAVQIAYLKGFDWVLTMDQDSEAPRNLINRYLDVLETNEDVGILTLKIKRNASDVIDTSASITEVDRCITSGSLMNLMAMREVGNFDESMFIDWVDHDICKKIKLGGYKIIRVDDLVLDHELGPQSTIKFTEFLNHFIGSRVLRKPHSAFRTYYYVRNGIYYIRKYNTVLTNSEKKYAKYEIFMAIRRGIVLGDNKVSYIKAILRGIRDGRKMKIVKENSSCQ